MTSKVDYTCLGPRIPSVVHFAQFNLHVIMGKRGNSGRDTLSNTWGVTENSHERPFSIIPKANTYGFLTKKWSPTEIQECDLWLGNICGVRCMSVWSMINGHTTPIFVENSHERPFSIIPKANTYGFLTKKWSPP
jgi:hypothetical protein